VDLSERWPLPDRHDLRDALLQAYADPARTYHDTRHLTEVLDRLHELAAAGESFDRRAVGLAAWFHDAVHEGRPDDEERSARWALDELGDASVARLVRMTLDHRPADDDPDGCALSDADLAILAAPAERYAEYAATVRQEYAHVPDADFRAGRAAVLRDLAAKPHLFHTAHARAHWEEPARANLRREIGELTGLSRGAPG
jgi:predicted metal-dependent HD superfamily phosphohydrolase